MSYLLIEESEFQDDLNVLPIVTGIRGSWARRLSKISDGLDAHVEVTSRQRNSTVWEVT